MDKEWLVYWGFERKLIDDKEVWGGYVCMDFLNEVFSVKILVFYINVYMIVIMMVEVFNN